MIHEKQEDYLDKVQYYKWESEVIEQEYNNNETNFFAEKVLMEEGYI